MSRSVLPAINGPSIHHRIANRELECEYELEPTFQFFMERAVIAGWAPAQVCEAFMGLADGYMLGKVSNAETNAAVRAAINRLKNIKK